MTDRQTPDALVFFGITGDLAYKKIFPALQSLVRRDRLKVPVIGVARSQLDDAGLVERARASVTEYGQLDATAFPRLAGLLRHVWGDYNDPDTFTRLRAALGDARRPMYYLAIPPSLFPVVVKHLANSGCAKGARIVVEKPFGRDLQSARALNELLRSVFDEQAIFRIDHYLGKEAVQNMMYFRFANSFLEPIWNRHFVDRVEVTMAESFGVAGRGAFYEETGVIRDVVQNHLLQAISYLAMEAPSSMWPEAIRDEQARVLRTVRPLAAERLVLGQFEGYRDEPGVAADSKVATFAAMRLAVDSWRWEGVPFFIRAGKCLATTCTDVVVRLKAAPSVVFRESLPSGSDYVRFRLTPEVGIVLGAFAKQPGEGMSGQRVELSVVSGPPQGTGERLGPYERLIGDAMLGDATLFARQDVVEAAWAIVDPVLREGGPILGYARGSWGPAGADATVTPEGGWPTT